MHVEVVVVVEGVVHVVLVEVVVRVVTVGDAVAVGGIMHVVNPGVEVHRRVIVVDVRRRKMPYLSSAPVTTQISSNSSEASCGF